jgi:hypothetical protein
VLDKISWSNLKDSNGGYIKGIMIPSRPYTIRDPGLHTQASLGLSWRDYNTVYELWLKMRYSDGVEPHTRRPTATFDIYLSEAYYYRRVQLDSCLRKMSQDMQDIAFGSLLLWVTWMWRDLGQVKREEAVLGVWEKQYKRVQQTRDPWAREEVPEMTLEWATGVDEEGVGNWIRWWIIEGQTKEEREISERDKNALPARNIRNEKWDRVNGVFEIENAAVPVKKSVRAFVYDGIVQRNLYIREFIREMLFFIVSLSLSLSLSFSLSPYIYVSFWRS